MSTPLIWTGKEWEVSITPLGIYTHPEAHSRAHPFYNLSEVTISATYIPWTYYYVPVVNVPPIIQTINGKYIFPKVSVNATFMHISDDDKFNPEHRYANIDMRNQIRMFQDQEENGPLKEDSFWRPLGWLGSAYRYHCYKYEREQGDNPFQSLWESPLFTASIVTVDPNSSEVPSELHGNFDIICITNMLKKPLVLEEISGWFQKEKKYNLVVKNRPEEMQYLMRADYAFEVYSPGVALSQEAGYKGRSIFWRTGTSGPWQKGGLYKMFQRDNM